MREKWVIILFNSIWDTTIGKKEEIKKNREKKKRKGRNKPVRTFSNTDRSQLRIGNFLQKGGWDKSSGNSSCRHSE